MPEATESLMQAALHVIDTDHVKWTHVMQGFYADEEFRQPHDLLRAAQFLAMSNQNSTVLWDTLKRTKSLDMLAKSVIKPDPSVCEEVTNNTKAFDAWSKLLQILATSTERSPSFMEDVGAKLHEIINSVVKNAGESLAPSVQLDVHTAVELLHAQHAPQLVPIVWVAIM